MDWNEIKNVVDFFVKKGAKLQIRTSINAYINKHVTKNKHQRLYIRNVRFIIHHI